LVASVFIGLPWPMKSAGMGLPVAEFMLPVM
jgi:hypothetical protein